MSELDVLQSLKASTPSPCQRDAVEENADSQEFWVSSAPPLTDCRCELHLVSLSFHCFHPHLHLIPFFSHLNRDYHVRVWFQVHASGLK